MKHACYLCDRVAALDLQRAGVVYLEGDRVACLECGTYLISEHGKAELRVRPAARPALSEMARSHFSGTGRPLEIGPRTVVNAELGAISRARSAARK